MDVLVKGSIWDSCRLAPRLAIFWSVVLLVMRAFTTYLCWCCALTPRSACVLSLLRTALPLRLGRLVTVLCFGPTFLGSESVVISTRILKLPVGY